MENNMKVGDRYKWPSEPYDIAEITSITGDAFSYKCSSDGYTSTAPLLQAEDWKGWIKIEEPQDNVVNPAHYTTTKISALDVVNDPVNPSHYNGTEVLDQMVVIYGVEAVKGFCICNAFKYRQRAGKKSNNIEEDIKKALWYEEKYHTIK